MTAEIKTIALSRVNNGAHYNFMSDVSQKAKKNAKVYAKVKDLVDQLAATVLDENGALVMSQKDELSDVISQFDKQREHYFRGYRNGVKSFRHFPAGAQKQAADKLWQHIIDYGIDPKMQLDRETGLLTNFIEDLSTKFAGLVTLLGLKPFLDGMRAANLKVRDALSNRNTAHSKQAIGAMKNARAKTDQAYTALIKRINAYAEIEGDADYKDFIAEVNTQIKRFKKEVIVKQTSEEKLLLKYLPDFEKELNYAPKILSYTGIKRRSLEKYFVYQLMVNKDANNVIWVKVEKEKLVKTSTPPARKNNKKTLEDGPTVTDKNGTRPVVPDE